MGKNPLEDLVQHLFLATSRAEFERLSDQQLLRRYLGQRDDLALGEIVRRHGAMIWAVCQRSLERRQDAEDVYQVIFLRLVRQARFVQRYVSVESWLYTVARNAVSNAQRLLDRQCVCDNRRAEMYEESYTDPQGMGDLTDILDEELGYLPEKCRSPIILCYLEGLTPEQAACRINISTPCLKHRLAEGRQRLHQRLSQRGINLDSPMLVAGLTVNLHAQQVPPRLMEKTLHMVRILTQSDGALETEVHSGKVMLLAKSAFETWTLKAKLLTALLLATLVLAGGSMIMYSGWLSFQGEQPQKNMPGPVKKARHKPETHETRLPCTDSQGDLVPTYPLGQLGTARFCLNKLV